MTHTFTRSGLTLAFVCLAASVLVQGEARGQVQRQAQALPTKNPLEGDRDAIQNGMAIFRGGCADCHSIDARGNRGPDLTRLWATGTTDDRLFQIIRRGVPGTEMPPSSPGRTNDVEVWQILAYLRTLSTPAEVASTSGNAANGERTFQAMCGNCHRVNGRGGRLGPDLSRIGSSRTRAALADKIRKASRPFVEGYTPVTLVTSGGQRIRGVKKNEDTFSIQIMNMQQQIQGYLKASLREVIDEDRSVMPSFGSAQVGDSELDDLLAYLNGLRSSGSSSR